MSNDSSALATARMTDDASPALAEEDYDAIHAAVMETVRGRWFLTEYARRNRHADTTMVLAALDRIEATMRGERAAQSIDRFRFDLIEMAKSIACIKAEIAAFTPDGDQSGRVGGNEQLESIVQVSERATSDILAAAEHVQEIAWTMREQGIDSSICDQLDERATDIYAACSSRDLASQRVEKVIQVMRYLEGRINAMTDMWDDNAAPPAPRNTTGDAALADPPAGGTAQSCGGFDQSGVDVMAPTHTDGSAAAAREAPARLLEINAGKIIEHDPVVTIVTTPAAEPAIASIDPAPAAPDTPTSAFMPTTDAGNDAATAESAAVEAALVSGPPDILSAASAPEPALAVVHTEPARPAAPATTERDVARDATAGQVAATDTTAAPSAAHLDSDPLAGAALIAAPPPRLQLLAPCTPEPIAAPPRSADAGALEPVADPDAPPIVEDTAQDTPAPVEPAAIASEGNCQSIAPDAEPVAPPMSPFNAPADAELVAATVTPIPTPVMVAARAGRNPLAVIAVLSEDEKIALFS